MKIVNQKKDVLIEPVLHIRSWFGEKDSRDFLAGLGKKLILHSSGNLRKIFVNQRIDSRGIEIAPYLTEESQIMGIELNGVRVENLETDHIGGYTDFLIKPTFFRPRMRCRIYRDPVRYNEAHFGIFER